MNSTDDLSVPDEFPARPHAMVKPEIRRHNSMKEKKRTHTTILLSITYFIFGLGVGLYAPLYPLKAYLTEVESYIYGLVISCSYLVAILFYPVAGRMLSSITCKLSICMSIAIIGCSKILFGILDLINEKLSFVSLSIAIEIVDGIGISILLVSTFIILFSTVDKPKRNTVWIMVFASLGVILGPICGELMYEAFGFGSPFYGVGALGILNMIVLAIFFPEPGQKVTFKDIPVISWMKESRLLIYSSVIFVTFNYAGFLAVFLEPYLQQFYLDKVCLGVLFSVPAFACGLTAPAWKWVTQKGINSLLLNCIASIFILVSLILIVPASFTTLDISLTNLSISLLLQGVGSGGKLACILFAADRDHKTRREQNTSEDISLQFVIPTMFAFSSFAGYFSGSTLLGIALYFDGLKITSFILYGVEVFSIVIACLFAFKRNYRAPRRVLQAERQPILKSQC